MNTFVDTHTKSNINQTCNVVISDAAQSHFFKLIKEQENKNLNLRIFVVEAGTTKAEVGITFCPSGFEQVDDLRLACLGFLLFIELQSASYLQNAFIDYQANDLAGELIIKAPLIKGADKLADDLPLRDRLEYIVAHEINPMLKSHKGHIEVVEVRLPDTAILKFGGGCQGCGMASVTLKSHVEQILKEHLPEITNIIDSTNHEEGSDPYY